MSQNRMSEERRQELLEYLLTHYRYDKTDGSVRHVKHEKARKPVKRNKHLEYVCFSVSLDKNVIRINSHNMVWVLCKGQWPKGELDHINGDKRDNRIENLRECTGSENRLNTLLAWRPNAVTGVPGVEKHCKKYRVSIHGKRISFASPYEAFFYATLCGKRYR